MSDSPDTEVAFRNPDNMEDTGALGDDDRFDDTVEDHGTYRRDRAGDVPDIGMGAHGFNRIELDGNGTAIKPVIRRSRRLGRIHIPL